MATVVTLNNVSYTVPATGDNAWGDQVSQYLIALGSGVLQKAGGSFVLTADVNFGATFGLKAPYFTSTANNPASAGVVRLASGDAIKWRNNANGADVALAKNSSDQLTYAGTAIFSSAGVLLAAGFPALTGDVTTSAGSVATSLVATSNSTLATLSGLTTVSSATTFSAAGTALTVSNNAQINGSLGVATTSPIIASGTEGISNLFNLSVIASAAMSGINSTGTLTSSSSCGSTFTTGRFTPGRNASTGSPTDTGAITGISVGARPITVQTGQTYTNTNTTGFVGVSISAPTLSGGGTAAITNIRGLSISANSVANTGTNIGVFIGAQSGSTNNACLADNAGFSGNYFINQSGTDASIFGGSLTAVGLTLSGAFSDSVNGAASTPAMKLSGTPYAAGSATTNKALFLLEDASTSNSWGTSGTYLGINAKTGFGGYLIDAQVNASRVFSVDSAGAITGSGAALTTLNASNLSSGTVPAARLPNPTSSSLGGVQSAAAVSHQWINSISTSGVPALSQPAFTDISGSLAGSQLPTFTGDVTNSGAAMTLAATSNATLTTLSALTSASSLATVGTVTAGTWNATTVAIAHGGTGQTSATAAFNALSPMTTLGDVIYGGASGTGTRLAGNTGSTKQYLSQTGTGSVSAAPAWAQVAFADLSGSVTAAQMPALTGDITTSAGAVATTLASSISGAKTFSTSLTSPAFISSTSNAASAGILRLASADTIKWRNNANGADVALSKDTSDQLAWAGTSFLSASAVLLAAAHPALAGDVTSSAGSLTTTVSKIAGTTVSATTGTGNVMFSASPTTTGTLTAATITASGNITATNNAMLVTPATTTVAGFFRVSNNTAAANQLSIGNDDSTGGSFTGNAYEAFIYNNANTALSFWTHGTKALTLDASQNAIIAGSTTIGGVNAHVGLLANGQSNDSISNGSSQTYTMAGASTRCIMLFLSENNNGWPAVFLIYGGGGSIFKLSDPTGNFSTTSNNSGTINVTNSGATLTIQNKLASGSISPKLFEIEN